NVANDLAGSSGSGSARLVITNVLPPDEDACVGAGAVVGCADAVVGCAGALVGWADADVGCAGADVVGGGAAGAAHAITSRATIVSAATSQIRVCACMFFSFSSLGKDNIELKN